ncbi:MAG: inorganic phosphate transporter [Bacteroidales bacterium]|nr:inorganic phosphate transporter [Bacteroidales bacterium]
MFGLSLEMTLILLLCLLAAAAFEFINGFHDTANAVATVIYTKSLKPTVAVVWSGIWNALGVFIGGVGVAMGILNLLPPAALTDQNIYHAIALVLALVVTAILWNLGTWYFGLPCSSSHTLIGSIFGVGLAYILLPNNGNAALNWSKVQDVGLSLLISPVIGFSLALVLMILLKATFKKRNELFEHQHHRKSPPWGVRAVLIFTCTSVSFSHGSNDGQKGIGLVMIVLIALLPAKFALDSSKNPQELLTHLYRTEIVLKEIGTNKLSDEDEATLQVMIKKIKSVEPILFQAHNFDSLKQDEIINVRKGIMSINKEYKKLTTASLDHPVTLSSTQLTMLKHEMSALKSYVEYAPYWVIVMIALSLGIGTMIGWKRIVVTVGEKIGKTPLTYAQGASAELIAASTILFSSHLGLPVSTTHVLSSGVAGTMVAKEGLKNLRRKTVRNILLAWVLTLPVTIVLAGSLFLLFRWIIGG